MGKQSFYEEEINHSPIFYLNREKEPAAFEREKNRLIENIYLYKLEENRENEDYGLEIVETVGDCLQYYDAEKGPFLHYFNRSFAQRKTKAKAKESLQDKTSGMHFTRKEIESSRAIHAFLKTHEDVTPKELVTLVKDFVSEFDLSEEEILEAIKTYTSSLTQSGDMEVTDEDGFTLFDMVASEDDFTESFASGEMIAQMISISEEEYLEARENTKEYLAVKLTGLFAEWDRDGEFTDQIKASAFFDPEIWHRVYVEGIKLKNKDISQNLNKSEANLTQTWKRFQKKLQSRLEEK